MEAKEEQDIEFESKEQDLLNYAWTIIANANRGNWDEIDPEWVEAAERWRDQYHEMLDKVLAPGYLPNIGAVGYLSSILAARADAWDGNAPDWFPEPPEWLELWKESLKATNDL